METSKKCVGCIDLTLKDSVCTVIGPANNYTKDKYGITNWKKPRNSDNLIKLENTISKCMKDLYEKWISKNAIKNSAQMALIELLEEETPILYIDCEQKKDDDILLFILKEYLKQSKSKNKEKIISNIIWSRTIVVQNQEERKSYITQNNPNIKQMLDHYSCLLKTILEKNKDPEYKNTLLNFEADIVFDGLGNLMENENEKYLYLYLDKISSLSVDEQCRINQLLYRRWTIGKFRILKIKINNGNKWRKTRTAANGHRVEATHDYFSTDIKEEDV